MFKKILLLFLFLFIQTLTSQTKITGNIVNIKQQALYGATVVVVEKNKKNIISYGITNDNGNYNLLVNSKKDTLFLEVSFLGYKKITKQITNKTQKVNFTLHESSEDLKEVIIKSPPPIYKKEDTINYSVTAFKSKKDRVIADVLAKMPGIEIESDGKILYEGKPIEKYYIEGLDLLEGKYNLANNNLPANAVSKVQILENHQPIKLLDSLVFSDKTSLNIKLKKNITVTGQAKLGTGFSPFLWDLNITPMLFSKKQQAISSYQANNYGNDISKEVKKLTLESLLDRYDNNFKKQDWLNVKELNPPSFHKKFWLNNNAHLVSVNYLSRIQKNTDLKINISYINDLQQQKGTAITTFYGNDTINLTENTANRFLFNALKTKLIYAKNKKSGYLKNSLEANKYWNSKTGLITNNSGKIHQNLENPYTTINNKLKWIFPVKKQLVSLKSVVGYSKTPQHLSISPGVYKAFLNSGNSFDKVTQNVNLSTFFTHNSLSFTKGIKKFSLTPKIGFLTENQHLKSLITKFENPTYQALNNLANNFKFAKKQIYTGVDVQYKNQRWKININLPLQYYNFNEVNHKTNQKKEVSKLLFEPKLTIKKDINNFWRVSFSGKINNSFGNISKLYPNYIITTYRNIQQYNNPILITKNYNLSTGIFYKNPLKSIFINSFYTYNFKKNNLLKNNIIDDNGLLTLSFIEQNNTNKSHSISTRISKYFRKFKSTITSQISTSINTNEQIINNKLQTVKAQNIRFRNQINSDIFSWLSTDYNFNISTSNIKFKTQRFKTIITQEHLFNITFYPKPNQYIKIENSLYKNNYSVFNKDNYFLNCMYKYTFKKQKIDVEFNFNNILNTKNYVTASANSYQYSQLEYQIRPRQFFVSVKFGL